MCLMAIMHGDNAIDQIIIEEDLAIFTHEMGFKLLG